MRDSLATCIYCGEVVDISKGTGDHVIPEAFGEFEGDKHFHRICSNCHDRADKSVEELIRCGPEAVLRMRLGITSKRSQRKDHRKQIGATGTPPPRHTVLMNEHFAPVKATNSPDDAEMIDYLVATDEEGNEHRIQLFPRMRPDRLRQNLDKANVRSIVGAHMQGGDETWHAYSKLLQEVQPGIKLIELPCIEPGLHRMPGRTFCTITVRYFQAIAKIAFHYYLIYSKRNLIGNEVIFQGIRSFILDGGDKDRFIESCQPRPVSRLETSLSRSDWYHLLAADESESRIRVEVQLFAGPDSPALSHRVTLGDLSRCIIAPDYVWGHKYSYCSEEEASARILGAVTELPILKLPNNFWIPPQSVAL